MEEQIRAACLRVRWRLVMGFVGLILAVAVTFPALSRASSGWVSEIWPNSPVNEIWPNAPTSEIWPNAIPDEIWP